ncbi:FG-GAP repeat domain-containing protein [Candidatus Midichloria mitochondrii]
MATFKPAVSYSVSTAPAGTAVGDLNNDGKPDIV